MNFCEKLNKLLKEDFFFLKTWFLVVLNWANLKYIQANPITLLSLLFNWVLFVGLSDGSFGLQVTMKTDKKWHGKCLFHRQKMSTHIWTLIMFPFLPNWNQSLSPHLKCSGLYYRPNYKHIHLKCQIYPWTWPLYNKNVQGNSVKYLVKML